MKITIEKTESGYSVTRNDGDVYRIAKDDQGRVFAELHKFIATPLPPKEPEIPACLHCGSEVAPMLEDGGYRTDINSLVLRHTKIVCAATKGGCGFSSGAFHNSAEKEKAIALWSGVKQ